MENDLGTANVRRFYEEVLNKGDLVVAEEILAPDYFDHGSPPDSPRGIEGFRQLFAMVSGVFPDVKVSIEDMVVGEGKVAIRLTIAGTQKGPFRGFPATGRHVRWTGIDIMRLSEGKISERWGERDFFGMLVQLGHVSPLE